MWVKWILTHSFADSNGFTRETFRIRDTLLHDGLEQLLLVDTIKWWLQVLNTERTPPVKAAAGQLQRNSSSVEVITKCPALPVPPAFHTAVLRMTTSPLLCYRAGRPQSERDGEEKDTRWRESTAATMIRSYYQQVKLMGKCMNELRNLQHTSLVFWSTCMCVCVSQPSGKYIVSCPK